VHAETVTETRIVKVAQLTAVSLALPAVPGVVLRTFIKPPLCPSEQRRRFPLPASGIGLGIGSNTRCHRVSTRAD
jgi:hypothetical protein